MRRHIEATLAGDPDRDALCIRAATKVVRLMTDNGTWPKESAASTRHQAAEALEQVLDIKAYANPHAIRQVREEMEALQRATFNWRVR